MQSNGVRIRENFKDPAQVLLCRVFLIIVLIEDIDILQRVFRGDVFLKTI